MSQSRISHIIRNTKYQIATTAIICLLIGGVIAIVATHEPLTDKVAVNASTSNTSKTNSKLSGKKKETPTVKPKSPNQSIPQSIPPSGSSQAAEYQKQADAAREIANKEALCLNTDQLAYSTFKHSQDSAYTYTVSQSDAILADNTLTIGQRNTLLAQIHADYNNTVDTAYAKYSTTVTKAGCQPSASAPSHWSGT